MPDWRHEWAAEPNEEHERHGSLGAHGHDAGVRGERGVKRAVVT